MGLGNVNQCWYCAKTKACLPIRSNPKGILGGVLVWKCKECREWSKEFQKELKERKEKKWK